MTEHEASSAQPDPSAVALGHEADMANVRVLSIAVGALALLSVVGVTVAWIVLSLLSRQTAVQTAGDPPPLEGLPEIRAPLDPAQPENLHHLQAWESNTLNSYSWVDQEAGIAAVPIERAIELVFEGGLPDWQPTSQPTGSQSP